MGDAQESGLPPTTPTPDLKVAELIAVAVGKSFDAWAVEHPSLSRLVDRTSVEQMTVESLRETPAYQAAVEAYVQARVEIDLLNKLVELAAPIVLGLLAG
jgi:hypothetical protein